jgi:hypothetical protein
MPKRARGITATEVKTLGPGRYADGLGLYLYVKKPEEGGGRYWEFIYWLNGKSHTKGLGAAVGPVPVSLSDARRAARLLYVQVRRDGIDPLADRDADCDLIHVDADEPYEDAVAQAAAGIDQIIEHAWERDLVSYRDEATRREPGWLAQHGRLQFRRRGACRCSQCGRTPPLPRLAGGATF